MRNLVRLLIPTGAFLLSQAAVANPTAPALPAIGDIYAVIVGYNGGREGLPDLRFADDDAIRFSLLLRGLETPSRPVHIWTLTALDVQTKGVLARAGLALPVIGRPTRSALAAAMSEVGRSLAAAPPGAPTPAFYFIYAGHGLDARVLLQPEIGSNAAITGNEILAAISELKRVRPDLRAFAFLDSCRSQSLFAPRGVDPEVGPDLAPQALSLERAASSAEVGLLTAAAAGKPAGEVAGLAAGYFSYVLASGLTGAADANDDQVVSFDELAAFVAFYTARQRPWFARPAGDNSQPAMDLRGQRTRLDLSEVQPGRYLVAGINGSPIFAEVFKGLNRGLSLVLPPGRYQLMQVTESGRAARAAIELRDGQVTNGATVALVADGGVRGGDDTDEVDPALAVPVLREFDPGEPAFSNPFGPEAVATLIAGYHAGREAVETLRENRSTLAVAATIATAPLGTGGIEPGVAVSYRRRFGQLFAGVRASAGRSSHVSDESYRLDRYAALLEAGPVWSRADRMELTVFAAGGAVSIVRSADASPTRGDLLAPTAGAGAGFGVHASRDLVVQLSGRYLVEWVRVDGARRARGNPSTEIGLSYAF